MKNAGTILAGAALLAATGCSAAAASHPASAATTANTRVCEHYRTQRAFVRNDTTPTLADVTKVLGWISADVKQATPGTPLARDLARMVNVMQGHGGVHTASGRVLADCQALGVTITP